MTLAVLLLYYLLRAAASGCSGAECDWFIPLSLLLPIAVVVLLAVTGVQAVLLASGRPGDRWWTLALAVLTVAGVLGPIVTLAIFRDSPARFVPIATILVLLLPLAALGYSLRARKHG